MIKQELYSETVLDAAKEVFETMIFMEIEPSESAAAANQTQTLMGSITFKGKLEGCLVISLAEPCALSVARNMLALDPEETVSSTEVCDAIGEVANMVMGSIKSRLQESFPDIEVSIPSVVSGKELQNTLGERYEQACVPVCIDEDFEAVFILFYKEK